MPSYAENTQVPIGRSRDEIERTVEKYGAEQVAFYSSTDAAMVVFVKGGKQVRFVLAMPSLKDPEVMYTPAKKTRTDAEKNKRRDQVIRSRWRSLALVVKAKFEAVETGIVTYEQEFGMHMVMPDGRTVADHVLPNIERAVMTGDTRLLLEAPQHG